MTATFSLTDELPTGPLVIEASAGTGKTFTLAALATRFIAEEGIEPSELLMVTFTRAATAELQDRVRERITRAAQFLAALDPTDTVGASDDPVETHLAGLPDRAKVLRNLERAVADFDTATICTIHRFAGLVLGLLGLSDEADGTALAEDTDELTLAVCADVLASEAGLGTDRDLLPKYPDLVKWTQFLLGRPGLRLAPDAESAGPVLAERAEAHVALVERCVAQVHEQRRRLGLRSFNEILTQLADELRSERASRAIELLRGRYRMALVDEFQDTDPVQWEIFRTLFGDGSGETDATSRLVLVGDPKQAIYAFRGADIHTYLGVVDERSERRSLNRNFRSDGAALAAVEGLLDGVDFGSEQISFQPVEAADDHRERRLLRADGTTRPGLQIRFFDNGVIKTTTGKVGGELTVEADAARRRIFDDLADAVIDVLDDGVIPDDKADGGSRPVRPSDVAVLVTSNGDAEAVRDALIARNIPAVLARGKSVRESAAAQQWRWLLDALARPTDPRRARAAALGWFGGKTVEWVDQADENAIGQLQEQLWSWSNTLMSDGLEAFLRRVHTESGVSTRVLARADGDRDLTDLDHIAELFRTGHPDGRSSIAGLLDVLSDRSTTKVKVNPNAEFEGDAASRRVATEDQAVQVMTVWVSKGLEFPIVCLPRLWGKPPNAEAIHRDDEGERHLDVLKDPWPSSKEQKARNDRASGERDGEHLRLLYVALTRARHQTILWWTRGYQCDTSALARVLFGRRIDGSFDPDVLPNAAGEIESKVQIPAEARVVDHLNALCSRTNEAFVRRGGAGGPVMEVVEPGEFATNGPWRDDAGDGADSDLDVATLDRTLVRLGRRWSFSSISSQARDHDANAAAEAATAVEDLDDEPETEPTEVEEEVEADSSAIVARLAAPDVSPLAPSPAGTTFGLLVHAIYEHVDFADPDLEAAIEDRLGRELSWRSVSLRPSLLPDATEAEGRRRLIDGVLASLHTPLGPEFDNRTLSSFGRDDRLDELDFEFRLADPNHPVTDRQLGRVLADHLPDDDPYLDWAQSLAAGMFGVDLAGQLTGSIDLILRVRSADGPDRYVVADYKTNRLHPWNAAPGPDAYSPDAMAKEMRHANYLLQALLYSVALHRYLRWRQPDYRPEVHLGGVRYLFVRGMAGEHTAVTDGQPHGVARWDLSPAAVVAVSDLLAGRPTPARAVADQGSLFGGDPS